MASGRSRLTAANEFGGATTIDSGTLLLGNTLAAGSGEIIFAYGADASLAIGAGDVPANLIDGFLPGITIDLMGIGLATAANLLPGDTLAVTGGSVPVALALDPTQIFTGELFAVQNDGQGGTEVVAETAGNDHPPSIPALRPPSPATTTRRSRRSPG